MVSIMRRRLVDHGDADASSALSWKPWRRSEPYRASGLSCDPKSRFGRVLATPRKGSEGDAQFLDEYGGLLKGREMSAAGGFVPIEESRIDPLAPQSRR